MMNFVFISPQFPDGFRNFCIRLKENGANVLGIGDCAYEALHPQLTEALTEYYRVDNMEDYDQMLRAVAYFTFHYGKIDWLESNNEYWMEQDARLRQDFHIISGLMPRELHKFKHKSAMKEYYARAGVPTARCQLVSTLEKALEFAHVVGYPLVAKPDNGVGAAGNMRLTSDEDMRRMFDMALDSQYLLEEYVTGFVTAFDGIVNSEGEIIFCASHVTETSIMDMVHMHKPMFYYVQDEVPADLLDAGRRVLKSFGLQSRSFHLEFFRLTEGKPGLGEPGDLVGLEVNMRPAGGYTPDMINYAASADYYQLWADMVCFDRAMHTYNAPHQYCVYIGRWDEIHYVHTMDEIVERYRGSVRDSGRLPGILNGSMGNDFLIVTVPDKSAADEVVRFALAEA